VYVHGGTRYVLSIATLHAADFSFGGSPTLTYYFEPKAVPGGTVEVQAEPLPPDVTSARYTENSEGFNNARDYSVVKPPHTFRIITLGDSWTFGYLVNTD